MFDVFLFQYPAYALNFYPSIWERFSIWRAYFSDGLKPPTSWCLYRKIFVPHTCKYSTWSFKKDPVVADSSLSLLLGVDVDEVMIVIGGALFFAVWALDMLELRCLHSLQPKGLQLQGGACGAILSSWGPAYFQGVFLMSFREFFDGFHHQTSLLFECEVFTSFFEDFKRNPNIPLGAYPRWIPKSPNEGNSFINCWGSRVCSRGILENSLKDGMGVKQVEPRRLFQTFVIFTRIHGEMIQFDEHIFHMGWFNHQLETSISTVKSPNRMVGCGGGHPPKAKMFDNFDNKHVDERFMGFLTGFVLKIMPPWKKRGPIFTKHLPLFKGEATKKTPSQASWCFLGLGFFKRFLSTHQHVLIEEV